MATSAPPSGPPPPGNTGLPGLGETIAFTRDPFAFVQRRRARYGRVFRTSLLGRTTAVLVGPEPLEAFYDARNVVRSGANPPNVQTLFGGPGVINNLDGVPHTQRKRAVSAALSREAIEAYVPTMTRFVDGALARWMNAGEIRWCRELERLAIETLGAVFAGIDSDAELDALVKRCERIAAAFTALPIPLPGTTYAKGVHAKEEALAYYRGLVRAHRAQAYDDGLARLLGAGVADDDAAGELHHLFLAGFIVFAQFAATIVRFSECPDVLDRVVAATATLPDAPSASELAANTYLMQVVDEIRRLTPIVPIVFGRAGRAFTVDGFVIPAGWSVAAAVWANDLEPASFPEPERFDPERFGVRAEQSSHAYAYTPQGAGPPDGHRCPGFDLTAIFMALFTARLVRTVRWELPPQDLAPDWTVLPPVPREGLSALVRAASR